MAQSAGEERLAEMLSIVRDTIVDVNGFIGIIFSGLLCLSGIRLEVIKHHQACIIGPI
jgi:hypothetical protein